MAQSFLLIGNRPPCQTDRRAMHKIVSSSALAPVSPYALSVAGLAQWTRSGAVGSFELGELAVEVRAGVDSMWALVRREGCGGVALRIAYLAGEFRWAKLAPKQGEVLRLSISSALGEHLAIITTGVGDLAHLRVSVRLKPRSPLLMTPMPRDLYPLDEHDSPLGAVGQVRALQRGLNAGLIYFTLDEPAFGNVLYFQNLSAMNDYYRRTGTTPDGAVGGRWPELGYLLPAPPNGEAPSDKALQPGVEVTISDAILVFRPEAPSGECEAGRGFLQMLGNAYRIIDVPVTEFRDWVGRAERTLRDLDRSPEATIKHYGFRYVHPYTGAEYPDIMVQMSIVSALHDWGRWLGKPHPLEAELKAGLGKFYDPKLKTLRRYLPNVGSDKNADAVDSWYLYHPLLNLGRLALDGDEQARKLFFKSLDYGIRSAHHFNYEWPVQYRITDFSVITAVTEADGRGQTDVGGIYAWIMLQAFEMTEEQRYLDEARAAIEAAMGLGFEINYQANLTAWGAAACMRLWRITNQQRYLDQSYVYLASFFHNCEIWESRIGFAEHYHNFLAVTCLQDAPYIAVYECFDSFAAFERLLADSGPGLEPAARMLVSEYCKYALDRAWYFYPDALPAEAISPKQRESNGHVDRKLSFPLEDVYADGQPAGQVGQEIYGAGAAFVFASRSFHRIDDAPFLLHCNHFIRTIERTREHALTIVLDGGETCTAALSLVRRKRRKLTKATVTTAGGVVVRPRAATDQRVDFSIPANGRVIVTWE
jgi:hypothetical protein